MNGFSYFVLIVMWCEINLAIAHDILPFWERDPKFDARRIMHRAPEETNRYKERLFSRRLKTNKGKTTTIKIKSTTEPDMKIQPIYTSSAPKQTRRFQNALRQGPHTEYSDEKTWPKIYQRSKQKKRPVVRSTRMQPYMQQPSKEDNSAKNVQPLVDAANDDRTIYPHSLTQQMKQLAQQYPTVNISISVLGHTVEYNEIVLMKMSEIPSDGTKYFRAEDNKYMDETQEKKIVFIVHGLSTNGIRVLQCLNELPRFKKLLEIYISHLDQFDIFLIPFGNPDGFSRALFALWNKNMSPQSACPGVNLDRNFDVAWNASKELSSCSQLYPGPFPFSEAETKAISQVFHHFGHKIVAYWHVHASSYETSIYKGDAILYPKGYTDHTSDDDKYIDLRGEIEESMKNASFQVISVTVDTLYNWYGKVSGTSVDFASTVYGIPYALELAMQPYRNDDMAKEGEGDLNSVAQEQIWHRLMDVLFDNIWRNTNGDAKIN